jgi:MOSC domain-containing protein YiiM
VFVYQVESYRYWERELGRSDFVYGQFGENFTVEGLCDEEVCIGERRKCPPRKARAPSREREKPR